MVALVDHDSLCELLLANNRAHAVVADGVSFDESPSVSTLLAFDEAFVGFDYEASTLKKTRHS